MLRKSRKKTHRVVSSYLGTVYDGEKYAEAVRKAVVNLRRMNNKKRFEAIAFTGTSGAALAYPLSLRLNKPLICVRKDRSHSGRKVEGAFGVKTYVIVDDFICTGKTVDRIRREIKKAFSEAGDAEPTCIGIYLYKDSDKRPNYAGIPVKQVRHD